MSASPDVPLTANLAPAPLIDRYPQVLGSNLNHAYISAAFRSCSQGYRQQYVDVLDELLEREPHGYAVLAQRILMTAGARRSVKAAKTEASSPDEALAEEARCLVERQLDSIPFLTQHFAYLLWSLYYGPVAAEILWEPQSHGCAWWITGLQDVHSRRLSYPDQSAWRLHIWDQGAVSTEGFGTHPSEQYFGFAIDDYPNKFIVHTPHLRGDYPTRDGLGRELAFWFSLKAIGARGAGQNVERFAKPWAWATYNTGSEANGGKPRAASDPDIAIGSAAVKALGTGSLSGATIPDSITLNLKYPDGVNSIGHLDFINLVDKQVSKAVLGNTDTTEGGPNGSRAATETRKKGSLELARYDASGFSATLTHCLARPIVELNLPHAAHLIPTIELAVDEEPDPAHLMSIAVQGAGIGMPIDADKMAAIAKLPLIPNETGLPRRCVPLKPMDLGATGGVSDAEADRGTTAADAANDDTKDGAKPESKDQ